MWRPSVDVERLDGLAAAVVRRVKRVIAGLCGTQAQPVQDRLTRIERTRATGETIPVRARRRVTRIERLRPFRSRVDEVQSSARIHAAGR